MPGGVYLELNQTRALRGPRAPAAQEGCRESQCWLRSQEPGLRTWLCHLPALASRTSSYTPLSLDFSTCTMGIKLIYFSGLLEEFKVIIQVHNHLYEFLGLRCVSEYFFFRDEIWQKYYIFCITPARSGPCN